MYIIPRRTDTLPSNIIPNETAGFKWPPLTCPKAVANDVIDKPIPIPISMLFAETSTPLEFHWSATRVTANKNSKQPRNSAATARQKLKVAISSIPTFIFIVYKLNKYHTNPGDDYHSAPNIRWTYV